MNYFKYFPIIDYTMNGSTLQITNIMERAHIAERIKSNITVLYDYMIQDGMRPDNVSQQLYGSPNYTWVILLINNFFTLFDWPLNNQEFGDYITERYGSIGAAQRQDVFKTFDGYLIDPATWATWDQSQGVPTNAYDEEFDANERKRRIKVVPANFVVSLVQDLKQAL